MITVFQTPCIQVTRCFFYITLILIAWLLTICDEGAYRGFYNANGRHHDTNLPAFFNIFILCHTITADAIFQRRHARRQVTVQDSVLQASSGSPACTPLTTITTHRFKPVPQVESATSFCGRALIHRKRFCHANQTSFIFVTSRSVWLFVCTQPHPWT